VYTFDELNLLVNPFAEKHLEGKVVIDYKQNYGYVLKNSFEILSFGMKFKRK
jgi:hypothetical protein